MQQALAASRPGTWRPTLALAALGVALAIALGGWTSPVHAIAVPPSPASGSDQMMDAPDGRDDACTGRPAFKAVIVVGPVGASTSRFIGWANQIAAAARDAGMAVCTVYTPWADAATVKAAARGASLFVALTHGNGYPRPNRTLQDGSAGGGDGNDATAHGLGLNASRGSSTIRYRGADWVRANLKLAPNAIVILSHMCYTAGNSEDYDRIPRYDLAVRHVDNFARGFLQAGSEPAGGSPSVVMALQSQHFDPTDPAGNLIRTLMTSPGRTLDQAFMTRYTRNGGSWKRAYLPNFGSIGATDLYVDQRPDGSPLRSPGRIHLDPDLAHPGRPAPAGWSATAPDIAWLNGFAGLTTRIPNPKGSGVVRFGYVRAITGRLDQPVADWIASASGGAGSAATRPGRTLLPTVRGKAPAKARAILRQAGFSVRSGSIKVRNEVIAAGRVINSRPAFRTADGARRKLAAGSMITLKVSTGP